MTTPKLNHTPTRAQILAACRRAEEYALEQIRLTSYVRAIIGDRPAILAHDPAARAAVALETPRRKKGAAHQ